jgi:adenylate kinase
MNQPIVFVGGIHGVGKTTVSRALAALLGAKHVTAGALIRETASRSETVTVGIGNKAVPNVDGNQTLLLKGLDAYRARVGEGPILLDGHFSLLDQSGAVVAIPMPVFVTISPVAVVLVEADHSVVHARLVQRDAAAPPVMTISLLADRERAWAAQVCATLKIAMWTVSGDASPEDTARGAAAHLRQLLAGVT